MHYNGHNTSDNKINCEKIIAKITKAEHKNMLLTNHRAAHMFYFNDIRSYEYCLNCKCK